MSYINRTAEYIIAKLREIQIKLCIYFAPSLPKTTAREKRIIASVTSYPGRLNKTPAMLGSLLKQSVQPDKIILYLSEEECDGFQFLTIFKVLQKKGVEICYLKGNIRSHKKYWKAFQDFPEDIVITFDDDVIYDSDLIEILYKSYKEHPECVSACKVLKMKIDQNGCLEKYDKWMDADDNEPTYLNYAVGVGAVLYPPHCVHEEVFSISKMLELAPTHDDLWLKIMELLKRTRVVLAGEVSKTRGSVIRGTQRGLALGIENSFGRNDEQIKDTFDYYNHYDSKKSLCELLLEDYLNKQNI